MLKKIFFFFIFFTSLLHGEVEINLRDSLKFKEIRRGGLDKNGYVIAQGLLEVSCSQEDIGKLIIFNVPPYGLMTNKKRWLKIEKIVFENNNNKLILKDTKHFIKIYGILNKHELNKHSRADINEGSYIGYFPINFSIYSKEL
ncbi:MAG: hypothetical protein ACRC1R_05620 [Cetobacterium sp.]|uniref:hypothetical protein n=1 Tax=Cetobacterium sp. TaxID=2071632 RepID=UPI003F3AA41A